MSLHKEFVELKEAVESLTSKIEGNGKVKELESKIRELEWDLKKVKDVQAFEIEKAKDVIRKEMEKSLIESDLKRVEAIAKLNTYIDMDTKDERKHIQKMLEEAIKSLGNQKVVVQK
jgi:ABC-type uncharacterized transport system auxiliary subunit